MHLLNNFFKKIFLLFSKIILIDNENNKFLSDLNYINTTYLLNTDIDNINTNDNDSSIVYTYKPNHYLFCLEEGFECFFIRKNKNFNKSRFSRNRQIYRTGVYFCFYINIAVFYSLWYYFYKFKIKFSYIWWLFILLPFSFIHSRALKFNLYFPFVFFNNFKSYYTWIFFFFKK